LRLSNTVVGFETLVSAEVSDTQVLGATTACYRASGGTLTLSHSLAQSCGTYGVMSTSSGIADVYTTFASGSYYGLYVGSGGIASQVTLTGNTSYGVYIATPASVTVSDSIIVNDGSYGLYVSSGTPNVHHNDVWGNSTNVYNASNTSGLSANPLFVGGS